MKLFEKRYIFFICLFVVNIPFLIYYSQNFVTTLVKFTTDELVYLENIHIILSQFFQGHILGAAYNLYSFAYGSIYWGITALVAAPFWLMGSEQGMIIALRLLSLFFSIASYFLVFLMLKEDFGESIFVYLAIFFSFLNPIIIDYSNMIHPEMVYVFFIVLALYFLHKDKSIFGKYYYLGIIAFAAAISAKFIACFFGLSFLIYIGVNLKKMSFNLLLKSFWIGLLSMVIPNVFLFFPLIFNRYIMWLGAASHIVTTGLPDSPQKSFWSNLLFFSQRYFNTVLFCAVIFLSVFACLFLRKKYKFALVSFYIPLVLVFWYFAFSVFYCNFPSHYGIALMFFMPFIVFNLFQILNYSIMGFVLVFVLNFSNIYGSIMRFIKPYSFSQIDFDPSKSKTEMLRVAELHISVYYKKNPINKAIDKDALRLAYDK